MADEVRHRAVLGRPYLLGQVVGAGHSDRGLLTIGGELGTGSAGDVQFVHHRCRVRWCHRTAGGRCERHQQCCDCQATVHLQECDQRGVDNQGSCASRAGGRVGRPRERRGAARNGWLSGCWSAVLGVGRVQVTAAADGLTGGTLQWLLPAGRAVAVWGWVTAVVTGQDADSVMPSRPRRIGQGVPRIEGGHIGGQRPWRLTASARNPAASLSSRRRNMPMAASMPFLCTNTPTGTSRMPLTVPMKPWRTGPGGAVAFRAAPRFPSVSSPHQSDPVCGF